MTSVRTLFLRRAIALYKIGLAFLDGCAVGGLILGISGHQHPRSGSRPNGAAFPAGSRGVRCWDQRFYLVTASAE
jgi:hypothetical protein